MSAFFLPVVVELQWHRTKNASFSTENEAFARISNDQVARFRSERQLMEQLDYNLRYNWFIGLSPDDPVWNPTIFTNNRERLQNGDVFHKFMNRLLNHPQVVPLLSDKHF